MAEFFRKLGNRGKSAVDNTRGFVDTAMKQSVTKALLDVGPNFRQANRSLRGR